MTTIKLRGINKVKKKLANKKVAIFYYHRATGTRLPGEPDSAEFRDAYYAADRIAPRDTGTVSALIREYLASPKFAKKRASTQKEYKRLLAKVEGAAVPETDGKKSFGSMPIAALASPRVIGKFITYQEEVGLDHPREADNRLTRLSSVFRYAKSKGRIARNPLEGFERLYDNDRSEMIWTEVEIKKFMKGAPVELQRALILAIHTGQRYGDLVRLRWADYDGTHIYLKQSKTSAKVIVRASAALKLMLDGAPKSGLFILTREDQRPWHTQKDDKALGKAWRAHMIEAGLYSSDPSERLHFNDLRGTAVTLLAEAGCTIPEIVAITGHSLTSASKILEKYLARTKTLSDAAIIKFENAPATGFANRLQTGTDD